MMIMITTEDFRRLSLACQKELLSLLSQGETESAPPEDEMSLPYLDADPSGHWLGPVMHRMASGIGDLALRSQLPEVSDAGAKKVIDISVEQARELIANVSEKSLDALRLFASGQPVQLDNLVGPEGQYRDFNDLKRSLVGAVNRRLRTVTENRSAVLFSSDRDKTRIRITPLSAAALRQALNVPEPLPVFDFYDPAGQAVAASSPAALDWMRLVHTAWQDVSARPAVGWKGLSAAQTLRHLVASGFGLTTGVPVVAEDHSLTYEYTADAGGVTDMADLLSRVDANGYVRLASDNGSFQVRMFLQHEAVPVVFATLKV